MRQFLLFSVAAVALTCAAPGQAASSQATDAPPRLFEGRDLFGLRYASQPEIRPDGAVVAYVRVTSRPRATARSGGWSGAPWVKATAPDFDTENSPPL